ncbi:MAG: triphosphoribosyl-dephospho-CoA synthase [Firmicutes bacterium]|nr:triphosphoribosyl-dephospho-CoA synthase [Bacillota bacterium]
MHKYIGNLAVQALKLEAGTTPKPGLVDRDNNGAHKDMDYAMFLGSSEALRSCFQDCAAAGVEGAEPEVYRRIGLAGERSMYQVTNHVNTHKGLIFSMGILCGALGELVACQEAFSEQDVQSHVKKLACSLLHGSSAEETHGQKVLKETGTKGIRGEAESGFASVFDIGLPALRKAIAEGNSINDALVKTLLVLLCHTEDSNVVYRGGLAGLTFVRKQAGEILSSMEGPMTGEDLARVRAFDAVCIEKNLSPGGSADLLALTAMLSLFFDENKRKEGE